MDRDSEVTDAHGREVAPRDRKQRSVVVILLLHGIDYLAIASLEAERLAALRAPLFPAIGHVCRRL